MWIARRARAGAHPAHSTRIAVEYHALRAARLTSAQLGTALAAASTFVHARQSLDDDGTALAAASTFVHARQSLDDNGSDICVRVRVHQNRADTLKGAIITRAAT